jgi:hypothetical protein
MGFNKSVNNITELLMELFKMSCHINKLILTYKKNFSRIDLKWTTEHT